MSNFVTWFPKTLFRAASSWLSGPDAVRIFALAFNRRPIEFKHDRMRSILIIKPDEIGDFVMSTPFLRELRRGMPQAEIVLVVKPEVFNIAEYCPYVNRIIIWNWPIEKGKFRVIRCQLRALRFAFKSLRAREFDCAIIPRWDIDTYHATQLAVYSGARTIVAYSEKCSVAKSVGNRGFDRLVSHVVPPGRGGHETMVDLALLAEFGISPFSSAIEAWLTPDDGSFAASALPGETRYIAIATGASKDFKRWPQARFVELTDWLQDSLKLTPVLLGSANDPEIPGALNFLGKTTLRQAAAIVARCVAFVGNDSGLKHIAASVKTPVVEINAFRLGGPVSHASSPSRFGAWGVAQRIVQPPGGESECAIEEVSLGSVQVATEDLLRELVSSQPARSC